MHRAKRSLRTETRTRLEKLEKRAPEWRPWLRLLCAAGEALDASWPSPLARQAGAARPSNPTTGAPSLDGRTLVVDAGQVHGLLEALASVAGAGAAPRASQLAAYKSSKRQAIALLEAAVRLDGPTLKRLATEAEVDPEALETVAQFLALPLLHASARELEAQVPADWAHGHCPICGARPILAELRGLDRTRLLRCGRCGSGWQMGWLRCAHCGEHDHEALGALVPEHATQTVEVETCESCRGYLKAVTTLQESPILELLLRDLETVEFDLVAVERGYARPRGLGYPIEVRVAHRSEAER